MNAIPPFKDIRQLFRPWLRWLPRRLLNYLYYRALIAGFKEHKDE